MLVCFTLFPKTCLRCLRSWLGLRSGRWRNPKSTLTNANTSLNHVSSSSEKLDLPSHAKKPFLGEEPGREEGESREPSPSIVYRDLKHKEKADLKRQLSPDPIIYGEVDISDLSSHYIKNIDTLR